MRFLCWRNLVLYVPALILISALAAACGGGEEEGQPQTPVATAAATGTPRGTATPAVTGTPLPAAQGPLILEVSTDKQSYALGEPVAMKVTMRPNMIAMLFYRNSQRYNFMVLNSRGQIVWSWAAHQTFLQETGSQVLKAGDEVTYEEVWDQRDNMGNQVPPGTYVVVGQSAHCDQNYENCGAVTSVQIEIRG